MTDGMYSVMRRINEIQTRFGLNRRHNTARGGTVHSNGSAARNTAGNTVETSGAVPLINRGPAGENPGATAGSDGSNRRMELVQQNLNRILQNNMGGNQNFLRALLDNMQDTRVDRGNQ